MYHKNIKNNYCFLSIHMYLDVSGLPQEQSHHVQYAIVKLSEIIQVGKQQVGLKIKLQYHKIIPTYK